MQLVWCRKRNLHPFQAKTLTVAAKLKALAYTLFDMHAQTRPHIEG